MSKIDLTATYYQTKVHPDDVAKTAVTTPFDLFEFYHMPFGLKNATSTFQCYMNKIFQTQIVLDDILVFSDKELQYKKYLDAVFNILHENNRKISLAECTFNVSNLDFM